MVAAKIETGTSNLSPLNGLSKSAAHFARISGTDLIRRTEPYLQWRDGRWDAGIWPYSRTLTSAPGALATVRTEDGPQIRGINFASQDYLGLALHPMITAAAIEALREYGPHSASSPMLQGNTQLSLRLERELAALLQMEHVLLFPTGWSAGFGTITGLVRPEDHILLDNLAHACLQQGAQAATHNVIRHKHLNIAEVGRHLGEIRSRDTKNAILVVTEGLFSMDSDTPDLNRLQQLCREFEATLLVDVAHDLGATGPGGTGSLGLQQMQGEVDLVVGAFSKTFASNGGFVATNSRAVKHYLKMFGGTHIFSNALSPVQAAVVCRAIEIVRSAEGTRLRAHLMSNICQLRANLADYGLDCIGEPSPIVPVLIGSERVSRLASALLWERQVFANQVEFPAVAIGSARFRMQVMASHTPEQIAEAAEKVHQAITEAREMCEMARTGNAIVRILQ